MTPFRDERVALAERVARLEDELREARALQAEHARVDEPTEPPLLDSRLLFGLIAGAVVVVGAALLFDYHADRPKVARPTDPTSLAEARLAADKAGLAPSGRLFSMKAWYVSSDGRFHAIPGYASKTEFVFVAPSEPTGASADPMSMFHDEYAVTLTPGGVQVDHAYLAVGIHDTVPRPHCGLVDVWNAARAAGAPSEAVAIIEYADGIVGSHGMRGDLSPTAHWHFLIASTPPFDLDVSDHDCTVMR